MEGTTKINLRAAAAAAQPSLQSQGSKFRVHSQGSPGGASSSGSAAASSLAAAGLTATAMSASSVLVQQQIILRLPDELAERLRKIINSTTKKDHHDKGKRHSSASSSSSAAAAAAAAAASKHGEKGKSDHTNVVTDLLIDVQPQGNDNDDIVNPQTTMPSNKYIFTFQQDRYYAMLANLPTNVETHKTFDKKVFVKVADVGQMLVVYPTGTNQLIPSHPKPSLIFSTIILA